LLVVRLARTGKKKQAYYRLVVADKRRAVSAKFIEILGNYDPHEKKLSVNAEKLNEYIKKGAQPSNTVARLLVKEKFALPKWVKIQEKVKKKKTKGKNADIADKTQTNADNKEAKPQAEKADEKTEIEDTQKDEDKTEEKRSQPMADQPKVEKPKEDKSVEKSDEKSKERVEQSETPAENADNDKNKSSQEKEEKNGEIPASNNVELGREKPKDKDKDN